VNYFRADTYTNGTSNSLAGFYGRLGYDYLSRYLLNATLRADASSRFGRNNRWGYFPSVSAAWRFSDEFPKEWGVITWLDDGKLRGSYGVTGNQAIGDYEAQTELVLGSYNYNGQSGVTTASKMGNTLLKWESTTQNNIGIDLLFLRGKLSFSGDYYVKDTKDLLYDAALPFEIGYSSGVRTNLGSLQNKGVELMLTWHVFDKRDYAWTTTVSWTTNKNKIVYLPGGDRVDDIWWIGEGSAVGTFYGWEQLGIYDYNESNAWTSDFTQRLTPVFAKDEFGNVMLDKQRNPTLLGYQLSDGSSYTGEIKQQSAAGTVLGAGDVIWQELPDEKGIINGAVGNEDRKVLGNAQPDWFAGWQNTVRYKDFSLSFSFCASMGGLVYNESERIKAEYSGTHMTPSPYFVYNLWKYPGQNTDLYRKGNYTYNTRRGGSYFLEDASYVRLQNLRLTYNMKKAWLQKIQLQNVQLYTYGNHLLTWSNYSGFDPEVNQTSVLKPGNDPGRYPRKREMGFGINVIFLNRIIMKKIIQIFITCVVSVIMFSACDDFLDKQPISSISPEIYWKSETDATAWMAGIYHQMQVTFHYNWFDWGEYRSDNVKSVGTGTAQTIFLTNQLSSTNQNDATSWVQLYTTISLCNFGLKYLPQMVEQNIDGKAATYEEYIGECYAMRALMYFYILRVWGRAPIVTEAIEGLNQQTELPRASIKEVRQQILDDADMALLTIDDVTTGSESRKFYLSKSAIHALLTDVYAWFQEYDKVIEASDNLMKNSGIKWIAGPQNWKTLFTKPEDAVSTENIFVMYWSSLEYNNGMGYATRLGSNSNSSNVGIRGQIFDRLYDRYHPEDLTKSDVRFWACFDTVRYKGHADDPDGYYNGGVTHNDIRQFGKCVLWNPALVNSYGNGGFVYEARNVCNTNMPIYRYADVMSLRAEALALTGRYADALEILVKMRARVGYSPTVAEDPTNYMTYYDAFSNKGEKLQEVIADERQLEFLAEGKRWFDLCRIGKTIFTSPYYDESGNPPYKIPDNGYYVYLKAKMNGISSDFTDFTGDNMGRILFPIVSGAFTANSSLRGDQNPPYDE